MPTQLYKFVVTGKVQGVYFRQSTKTRALQLGLSGFAKNMEDGTVLIHAEGNEEQINELVAWCHHGPPLAHVIQVLVIEISPPIGYVSFSIN